MPAKAICPRDSKPDHPVSTVSDDAQMAKARTVAYSRFFDGWVMMMGRTTATSTTSPITIRSRLRIHRTASRWAGTGRRRGAVA